MFDQTKAIHEWQEALASRGLDPDAIEELKTHLEDALDRMMDNGEGMSEGEAFTAALRQLGSPQALGVEFRKIERLLPADWAVVGGAAALLAALVGVASVKFSSSQWLGTPLSFHVGTLFLGYSGMLLLSGLGIYTLARRALTGRGEYAWFEVWAPLCRWAAAAGLTLVGIGIVTGAMWARDAWGIFWAGSPKEFGALGIWLWYLGAFACLSVGRFRLEWVPALAISGGVVCLVGWFGVTDAARSPGFFVVTGVLLVLLFFSVRLFSRLPNLEETTPIR